MHSGRAGVPGGPGQTYRALGRRDFPREVAALADRVVGAARVTGH